jgi:K+-transporting ATPase A subunit
MWPAITLSALSAGSLIVAGLLGWRIGDEEPHGSRRYEGAAGLFIGLAILLLLVAAIFWLQYLIFGPIGEWFHEYSSDDEIHK